MPQRTLDAEIDRLYQLPLDQFTAARNALAKQAGSASTDIRALQKPPVAAWAVNQVYWRNRPAYDALIEAANNMRATHRSALAGKKADLRTTGREHEKGVEAALKAALAALQNAGHGATDAIRQAIATTLRTLPAEDAPGRLTRTLQPGGFEALAGLPVTGRPLRPSHPPQKAAPAPRSAGPAAKPRKPTAAETRAIARAKDVLARANRTLRAAEHTARREEFESARAAREEEKARRALAEARDALESAQRALEDAEREAAEALRSREAAERRTRAADEAVEAARADAADAQQELARLTESSGQDRR